jgi:hypothetical protein
MPHSSIVNCLFSLAAYAEHNGLHELHLELCAVMATAMLCPGSGQARSTERETPRILSDPLCVANVIRLSDYQTANT